MAQRITTSLQTSKGTTTEAYYHINDFRILKDGKSKVQLKWFQSEADRIANENDTVRIAVNDNMREVYSFILTDINSTVADAYAHIALLHKAEGHTVESDDSGSWTQI